jgi:hypothetical protein
VADLLARAEVADQTNISDGMSIPDELARREDRLGMLTAARAKIEARAEERFPRELAEHEAKLRRWRRRPRSRAKNQAANHLRLRSRGRLLRIGSIWPMKARAMIGS